MTTAQRTESDGPAGEFRKITKPVKTQKIRATDARKQAYRVLSVELVFDRTALVDNLQ